MAPLGQGSQHKAQNMHLLTSISNLVIYRFFLSSGSRSTSMEMHSTGQESWQTLQAVQMSRLTSKEARARSGSCHFSSGYWRVMEGLSKYCKVTRILCTTV